MTMVRLVITMHDTYKCIKIKYDLSPGFGDFLVFGCCCKIFQTERRLEKLLEGDLPFVGNKFEKNDKLGWHAELRVLYDATTGSTNGPTMETSINKSVRETFWPDVTGGEFTST